MRALPLALFATLPLFAQWALYIDLAGEWRRSTDDQANYTQPDFDDRAWAITRLPWEEMPCRRGTTCTFWLRRSIDLPDRVDKSRLALTLGPVSPIYEVYANGTRIGATGPFDATSAHVARSRTHHIPAQAVGNAGRLVLAIRARDLNFATQPLYVFRGGSYLLTYAEHAPVNEGRYLLDQQRARYAPSLVLSVLLFAFAFLLGLLWLAGRGRTEPLWLGLLVALRAMFDWNYYSYLQADAGPYSFFRLTLFGDVALVELSLASAGINARWLRVLVWAVGLGDLFMGVETRWIARAFDAAAIGIVLTGWRRNGGVLQTPVRHLITAALVLLAVTRINSGGVGFLPVFIDFAGYLWSLQSLATALFAGMLTILLVLSLGADRKEKQRLAGELEAARGVQQLLVAGGQPITKDYAVESVYEPAEEVGGDFYQVLPAGGGALLVVVGDVSGKGLKAALVVSMMAGVVRAHVALPPAALLKEMNRVLGEGSGGFVTCLAIRCEPGGLLTMANAGHLAPYRDGVEVPVDSGLPLGVALDAEYSETSLRLDAGVLTIVTDGIVEAANAEGDLFGFDRTREISKKSAQEIADAAKAWGQNDDITVVTVRRIA